MDSELSFTEENYLKAVYHLSREIGESVSTNAIAESVSTSPASVNDMIKRLSSKNLLSHQKYKGAKLLPKGEKIALGIVRKHRLWEVFLVEKLNFKWDEVHEIAEQLEHINSPLLISRLDEFLGNPTVDPHGDPIPDENGRIKETVKASVAEVQLGAKGVVVAVSNDDSALLKYLDKIGIQLGAKIMVTDKVEFDGSVAIRINESSPQFISKPIAENLLIKLIET